MHKLTPLLPHSPRKRKAVISKLTKSSGLSLSDNTQHSPSGNKKIDESTVQCVQKFYFQDSISWQAPGRRDYVIVRQRGKKSKLQKRHLMWSLTGFIQKIATIFQGLFKDHIRFSRTTY